MSESAPEPATTPARPRLKPWYRLSANETHCVLRYGGSVLEFEGGAAARLLPHLLPLLDGSRTVDAIVAELGEPIRPAVEHALRVLAERRLLTDAVPPGLDGNAARTADLLSASDLHGRDATAIAGELAERRVVILGSSAVADRLSELLAASGRPAERADWEQPAAHDCDLAVAAPSASEVRVLPDWNRHALERGTTWLQVLPFDGLIAAVGPVFVPHESACYECYRLRRSANVSQLADTAVGGYPTAPALDAVLAGFAAVIALRRLALGDGLSVGVLLAIEQPAAPACSRHVLYRVPRCPACSPAAGRAVPSPWSGVARVAA